MKAFCHDFDNKYVVAIRLNIVLMPYCVENDIFELTISRMIYFQLQWTSHSSLVVVENSASVIISEVGIFYMCVVASIVYKIIYLCFVLFTFGTSSGCPECTCNRPRPRVSDWGCGAMILLSRGEFVRKKNKICYQRGCVWTFCFMPNL